MIQITRMTQDSASLRIKPGQSIKIWDGDKCLQVTYADGMVVVFKDKMNVVGRSRPFHKKDNRAAMDSKFRNSLDVQERSMYDLMMDDINKVMERWIGNPNSSKPGLLEFAKEYKSWPGNRGIPLSDLLPDVHELPVVINYPVVKEQKVKSLKKKKK